jgi:hypothetical protein
MKGFVQAKGRQAWEENLSRSRSSTGEGSVSQIAGLSECHHTIRTLTPASDIALRASAKLTSPK